MYFYYKLLRIERRDTEWRHGLLHHAHHYRLLISSELCVTAIDVVTQEEGRASADRTDPRRYSSPNLGVERKVEELSHQRSMPQAVGCYGTAASGEHRENRGSGHVSVSCGMIR